jgi:CheY-like chemotaxis protein
MKLGREKPKSGDILPEGAPVKVTPSEYNGYRFASDIVSALTSLIVGLAWPVTALIIVSYLVQHGSTFVSDIQELMKGNKQVELTADVKSGVRFVVIAQEVQKGLTQQATTQAGGNAPQGADVTGIQQVAAQAASQFSSPAGDRTLVTKVLWVDDHPQNNLGLAYAFQALGIIVVCVDSNAGITEAFATSGGFDVVITDMSRDAVAGRAAQPEGGLETVNIIKGQHGSVPVIIFAGGYAASHANDLLQAPVIAITSDSRVVFSRVTGIASKKGKKG